MAHNILRLGPLSLALTASRSGASLSASLSGKPWDAFVERLRGPRRNPVDAPAASDMPALSAAEFARMDFRQQVESLPWYHTHDFGEGIKSRGQFDHAPILDRYCLPADLGGKRVLDVATFDGFWAFEFERRGAREVVALDLDGPAGLDWPPLRLAQATPEQLALKFGRGFELAKARFGSSVERVSCNVYELDAGKFGSFDVVHAGDFLLHLNNPVRALQNMAKVCEGYALISEVYAPELDIPGQGCLAEYRGGSHDVTWWRFSLPTLERMILDAGFARVERLARFRYGPAGMPETMHHAVFRAWKH